MTWAYALLDPQMNRPTYGGINLLENEWIELKDQNSQLNTTIYECYATEEFPMEFREEHNYGE